MSRKLSLIMALLLVMCLPAISVFAWGSAGSDGTNYLALQETAVFYNNSGHALSAGYAVILDSDGTAGSTLGAYVEDTATDDSVLAVGIVKSVSAPNGGPVVVVTKGPVDAVARDSTDGVTTLTAVGTTSVSSEKGYIGGGTNLGIALEAGNGTDGDTLMIWVDPTGAD